jgi:hypothetical protein
MQKLFDKILAARIKDVFDHHEEGFHLNDWENMRAKLGKKTGRKVVYLFPFIAKAASVILFVGLSVFYVNQNLHNQNILRLPKDKSVDEKDLNIASKYSTENQNLDKKSQNQANTNDNISNNNYKNTSDSLRTNDELQPLKNGILKVNSPKDIFADIRNILDKHRESIQKMTKIEKKDSIQKILPELIEDDNNNDLAKEKKNFEFGVELASVSNYAINGSSKNLNVGGGFSAGYRLSKNLSLESGMVISKQDLTYDGSAGNHLFSKNKDSAPNSNYMALAAENSLNMIDGRSAESNISFIAIDIPMNIQYRHKKIVLSAGISSLVFVNEKYRYNYDVIVNSISFNSQTASYESLSNTLKMTSDQTNESFKHFDFAGLLNISVAYDIPLAKGSLAFEPYVKLPLTDISSQDIRMGSGGIAVRYNF